MDYIDKTKSIDVLLSLGSNIGNKTLSINKAIELLKSRGAIKEVRLSSFYETEPVGEIDQDFFVNIALLAKTELTVDELLIECKSVEELVGRTKRERWREREIDIDIIAYGKDEVCGANIEIPHPRMHERNFVLIPINEIAPDFYIQKYQKTILQLLIECLDESSVKRIS